MGHTRILTDFLSLAHEGEKLAHRNFMGLDLVAEFSDILRAERVFAQNAAGRYNGVRNQFVYALVGSIVTGNPIHIPDRNKHHWNMERGSQMHLHYIDECFRCGLLHSTNNMKNKSGSLLRVSHGKHDMIDRVLNFHERYIQGQDNE